jgi:hypothetical protein
MILVMSLSTDHPTMMTRDEFRQRLHDLDMGIDGFAWLTDVHKSTVIGWGAVKRNRGMQHYPTWVHLLLTAWQKDRCLLDDAWDAAVDAEAEAEESAATGQQETASPRA